MPAGTITALRAQAKDTQRVNLFVNDEFAVGVSLDTIAQQGLYVGKALTEEEYTRIERAEGYHKALQAALRFLEARPRSVAEIRERLQRKEFSEDAIEAALGRLTDLGMLDDAAFARFWVENRQACRPRGVGALRDELRRKGVDRAVVETILGDNTLTGDEAALALALARGALHKYAGATDRVAFQRRMGGYLQRRGFSFAIVGPIVDRLWTELHRATADS